MNKKPETTFAPRSCSAHPCEGETSPSVVKQVAVPRRYDDGQVLEIFAEAQRNVDNAALAMKCADFGYAEIQMKVALEKIRILREEAHRHSVARNDALCDGGPQSVESK